MNLQIVEQKTNAFLSRKEIKATLSYDNATPSKEELKKQFATATKADVNTVVIKHIYPGFGHKQATVLVYQYDKPESVAKFEPKKKEKKAKGAEEKAK
ncbi:MAG: hypothetical protein V1837_01745 [Candidatus Woesearchaeota archaeon]